MIKYEQRGIKNAFLMFSGKAMEIVTPINIEKDYQKAPALIEPFLIKRIHKSV